MPTQVWILIVAQLIALTGFAFGLSQYARAQKWKRLEFAAGVLDKLRTDPGLRLAIIFLDWRARDVYLPKDYSGYVPEGTPFRHSLSQLAAAYDMGNRERLLETRDFDLKPQFLTADYLLYVDVLDRFFEYLGQVHAFLEMGVLTKSDVRALRYWVAKLHDLSVDGKKVFMPYLKHHESNVLELMVLFGMSGWG